MDHANRRRYPRSRSGFPGVRSKPDPGVLNHVDNISCNGVLCHTLQPIAVMTKMGITLELPGMKSPPIEAEGIVVRCEPDRDKVDQYKVAILFSRLHDKDHAAIRAFVDQDLAGTPAG